MTKRASTPAIVAIHRTGVPIDSVACAAGSAAACAGPVSEVEARVNMGSPQNAMSEVSFIGSRRPHPEATIGPPD